MCGMSVSVYIDVDMQMGAACTTYQLSEAYYETHKYHFFTSSLMDHGHIIGDGNTSLTCRQTHEASQRKHWHALVGRHAHLPWLLTAC